MVRSAVGTAGAFCSCRLSGLAGGAEDIDESTLTDGGAAILLGFGEGLFGAVGSVDDAAAFAVQFFEEVGDGHGVGMKLKTEN